MAFRMLLRFGQDVVHAFQIKIRVAAKWLMDTVSPPLYVYMWLWEEY
jgi:hypothetical protein